MSGVPVAFWDMERFYNVIYLMFRPSPARMAVLSPRTYQCDDQRALQRCGPDDDSRILAAEYTFGFWSSMCIDSSYDEFGSLMSYADVNKTPSPGLLIQFFYRILDKSTWEQAWLTHFLWYRTCLMRSMSSMPAGADWVPKLAVYTRGRAHVTVL